MATIIIPLLLRRRRLVIRSWSIIAVAASHFGLFSLFHPPPLVFHVSICDHLICSCTCTALEVDLWGNYYYYCKSPIMAFQNAIYYSNFTRTILPLDHHLTAVPRFFHVNILSYSHISPFYVNYYLTFFAASIRGDSS